MKYSAKAEKTGLLIIAAVSLNACFSYSADEYQTMDGPSTSPRELPAEVVQEAEAVGQVELMSFIQRLSLDEATMLSSDQDLLQRLPNTAPPQSLLETAIGIGLIAKWHTLYQANMPQIEETDLGQTHNLPEMQSREDSNTALLPSLEVLVSQKSFDLAQALEHNALLKSYPYQQRVLFALTHSKKQTSEFVKSVRKALKLNSRGWEQVQRGFAPEPQNSYESPNEHAAALSPETAPAEIDEIAPPLEFGSDTFVDDEAVLKEAQDLRDQGEYSKAIAVLKSLGEDSPFNAAALDRVKEISNIGVQDLRRKAARAFQSAKPINDKKTKAAYLSDAKNHLEKALEIFPDADQINTVRQNLEVIKRSLGALQEQIRAIEDSKESRRG